MELNPGPGESSLERFEDDGERERPSRELLRGLAMVNVECARRGRRNKLMHGHEREAESLCLLSHPDLDFSRVHTARLRSVSLSLCKQHRTTVRQLTRF